MAAAAPAPADTAAPTAAAAPTPTDPVAASTLPVPAPGTLVTDAELASVTDPRTNVTTLDVDADGSHLVAGPGSHVGVVVGLNAAGAALVVWFDEAGAYELPLLPLLAP